LRETLDLCREGRELVGYCAGELDAVGEGLKELRLDDLAARLDTSADPPA
jgi:exodeoxyribonuclease VII small subunit